MTSLNQSVSSSAAPSISDLDGFTLGRDYNYPMTNSYMAVDQDEFGFDPPAQKASYTKFNQTYSPPEMGDWPGFEAQEDTKETKQGMPGHYQIDRMIAQTLPNATTAISRFGQVTPPRTNSTSSEDNVKAEETPRASGRKRTKTQPADSAAPKATPGRKRKTSKKSAANAEQGKSPEDTKRKASLEKNRVAAAKCRINKKEKTEQLQRDSHEKGLHNAFLRDQVMRMRTEVQQMHSILLAHANCEGCKSPDEIQKHLANLGQEYMANQMLNDDYNDYSQMEMDDMREGAMVDDYFSSMSPEDPTMLHPPLPEFNRSAEFEVHTPMLTE